VITVDVHGVAVPALGLGTWMLEGEACRRAVGEALALGYRHLDTAQAYGNEAEVGRALRESAVAREEVFVTTKVWLDDLAPDRLVPSVEASLRRLGSDHVDLLLVHWPSREVPLEDTLEALEGVRRRGWTRLVGVSNFPPSLLRRALAAAPVACDQVEYHPFLAQDALLAVCREHGALLTAYSPLARGRVLRDPVLREIAEAHGATPAQVALRWLVAHDGVAAIPKASSREHLGANLASVDLALSATERARIDGLARGQRLVSPSFAPDWES
jgi:2,5-diketo-D-gluconate reductase B